MRWLKYTEKSLIPKVKERMLLILSVESDSMVPAHIVQELHISKPWASYWLNRYVKKAYKGLEINQRVVDHPSQLPKEIVLSIRKKLLESKQGWSTKH